jgi:heat shock protein HspQ
MADKFLYVVEHFIPFPQSEYGGIWNVIAENDEECFDLIAEKDEGFNQQFYGHLRENIQKSLTFLLAEEGLTSEVVEEFTT